MDKPALINFKVTKCKTYSNTTLVEKKKEQRNILDRPTRLNQIVLKFLVIKANTYIYNEMQTNINRETTTGFESAIIH